MLLTVKGVTLTDHSFDGKASMYLVKGKIAFGFLLVCYVVFFLAVSEDESQHAMYQDHHAYEAAVAGSGVPWSEATLEAQDAPPMAILLTRLQGVQSYLFLLEDERASNLSASLASLTQKVELQFDLHLYTPFTGLSDEQREVYSEVLQVIIEVETLMNAMEETESHSGKYSTVTTAS